MAKHLLRGQIFKAKKKPLIQRWFKASESNQALCSPFFSKRIFQYFASKCQRNTNKNMKIHFIRWAKNGEKNKIIQGERVWKNKHSPKSPQGSVNWLQPLWRILKKLVGKWT